MSDSVARENVMNKRWKIVAVALLSLPLARYALADDCDVNDPTLLKPDLVALPPADAFVIPTSAGRALEFTTSIGNVGDGPLMLRGQTIQTPDGVQTLAIQEIQRSDGTSCTHEAGVFVYHPEHSHWHFENFSDYQLRKDDPFTGEIVRRASKISFCLLDVMRLPGYFTSTQFRNSCASPTGTEGISVGYADVYEAYLPGQQIDLDVDGDTLPPGDYFLVNVANPQGLIIEKNDDLQANSGVVSISIGVSNSRRQGAVTVHQPLEPPVPIHPKLSSTPPPDPASAPPKKPMKPKKPSKPPGRIAVVVHQPHSPHTPGQSSVDAPSAPPQQQQSSPPQQQQSSPPEQQQSSPPPIVQRAPHFPHTPHQPGQ
jgi:lysyl oxidase